MKIMCAYTDRNCDYGCMAYRLDGKCQRLVNDENIAISKWINGDKDD